jgi:hypothetical protein
LTVGTPVIACGIPALREVSEISQYSITEETRWLLRIE